MSKLAVEAALTLIAIGSWIVVVFAIPAPQMTPVVYEVPFVSETSASGASIAPRAGAALPCVGRRESSCSF